MRGLRPWLVLSAISFLSLLPSRAFALVEFCNNFPETVYFSIAYEQSSAKDTGTWFISRGWMEVQTNMCSYFDTSLKVGSLYFYAETNIYRSGKNKVKTAWPAKGDRQFWQKDDNFNYWSAEKDARPDKSAKRAGFAQTFTAEDGDLWETVTINQDGTLSQTIGGEPANSAFQPETPATPVQPQQPAAVLDAGGQKLVDDFKKYVKDDLYLYMIEAGDADDAVDEPPAPAQARVTYKFRNKDQSVTTDLSLLVFGDEDQAKRYVGDSDTKGHYADDVPQGVSTFGHITNQELPSGIAYYTFAIDPTAHRIWLRCATVVGRAVIVTKTLEPTGDQVIRDTLPEDKMIESYYPLAAGATAIVPKQPAEGANAQPATPAPAQ